ncbi:unnamed protein product [Dibothriocephalus latus]|uniref:AWS domain-containing protein n=1 Tax=Dibothriocephalus latus TaxID=60516 RepID=A0A3P6QFQ6_DIBLA|nr:unnamed protein product [Dibothriocephalus latus]
MTSAVLPSIASDLFLVNYPIGSVRLYRYTDLSEVLQCECKATPDVEPCGPNSGCINRELLFECVPGVCVHGEKCRNQRFTRREYPPQRPFWTGDERGWGLKTLCPIAKVGVALFYLTARLLCSPYRVF